MTKEDATGILMELVSHVFDCDKLSPIYVRSRAEALARCLEFGGAADLHTFVNFVILLEVQHERPASSAAIR